MNTYAIPALKEKRAYASGRIISLKKEIKKLQGQLVNLDATITLFDPTYRVGNIKPKNPRKKAKVFKPGALSRLVIDALRRAEAPQLTSEVLAAITATMGEEKANEMLLASTVRSCLGYLTRRGKVAQIGKGIGTTWRLASMTS
jgi:hypothetical protein